MEETPLSAEPASQQPPINYPMPEAPKATFFTPKVFFIGGVGFFVVILIISGLSLLMSKSSPKKNITPTPVPTLIIKPTTTPRPIVYPTSFPDVTTTIKTPTPTATKTNNSGNNQSSATSPTNTPVPAPTTTATTGSISGEYYDFATHSPLTDSQFAVSALSDASYARSDDKPTWTMSNLKPGHYKVSINVNTSKYNQHDVTCSNCSLSSTQFGYTELDLKAGDNVQLSWLFDPK